MDSKMGMSHSMQTNKTPKRMVLNFVEVKVHCDKHGEITVRLLESLAHKASCTTCQTEKGKIKLKEAMDKATIKEFYAVNLPSNTFTTFSELLVQVKSPKQQKIAERFKKYVDDIVRENSTVNRENILLTGNMGAGKTIMASALLQAIIRRSILCDSLDPNDIRLNGNLKTLFTTEAQLNTDIYATWRKGNDQTYKKLMGRLISTPILCIDDVGSSAGSEPLLDAYVMIIDERYKRRLPTIMTSNVPYDKIQNVIGDRSKDRFSEKNRIIAMNCDWSGYRTPSANEIEFF